MGYDFPDAKVVEINQFLESRFEEHMFMWVDARAVPGKQRKKLIEKFVEKHGISVEEDISLHALVKTEYRMRRELERNLKAIQQAPPELFKLPAKKNLVLSCPA